MKHRLEQLNQAYKKALGEILVKLLPGVLPLSVTDVLLDPSLKEGRVWLVATPENLALVESNRPEIQAALPKLVKTRYLPKFQFLQDDRFSEKIDALFEQIS